MKAAKVSLKACAASARPGLRRYVGATEIPRVRGGLGISIVSTSARRDDRHRGPQEEYRRRIALLHLVSLKNFMSRIGKQPDCHSRQGKGGGQRPESFGRRTEGQARLGIASPHEPQSRRRATSLVSREGEDAEAKATARLEPRARQQHGQRRERRFRKEARDPGRRFQGRRAGQES